MVKRAQYLPGFDAVNYRISQRAIYCSGDSLEVRRALKMTETRLLVSLSTFLSVHVELLQEHPIGSSSL